MSPLYRAVQSKVCPRANCPVKKQENKRVGTLDSLETPAMVAFYPISGRERLVRNVFVRIFAFFSDPRKDTIQDSSTTTVLVVSIAACVRYDRQKVVWVQAALLSSTARGA